MHDSVKAAFLPFNERWEGRVHWPYLDVRGLVTTGVGNLIDPLGLALYLPWTIRREEHETAASSTEIAADWTRVKGEIHLASRGHRAAESYSKIRLSDAAIDRLVFDRLAVNDLIMASTFDGWDAMPADAQLGILSMCWALGAAAIPIKFPRFTAAVRARNWAEAARQSPIRTEGNPGIIPRNAANRICFDNAAKMQAAQDAALQVYWPNRV